MNPCVYCANRERDVYDIEVVDGDLKKTTRPDANTCAECDKEGKFRHLSPMPLRDWEIPDLPPYYKLMEMDAYAVRAMFYLVLHHLQKKVYY